MPRTISLAATALMLALAVRAEAAFDCYVQVAQPHDQPEAGSIGMMYVTYELMLGSASPGVEIEHTCSPGPVAVDTGSGYSGVQNRNGANQKGFKIVVEDFKDIRRWSGSEGNHYIETMTVLLDVRSAADSLERTLASHSKGSAYLFQQDFDGTVACTVDCILDNATRSSPPIRRLRLEITGPIQFKDLARTYEIVPAPKRKEY